MDPLQHFTKITLIDRILPLDQQLQADKDLALTLAHDELIIRFWSAQGIILGKLDSVLPDFAQGLSFLQTHGHETLIRKAGGLAVVCDEGILNLSLLFNKNTPAIGGLNESYVFVTELVRYLLRDLCLTIETGEISASYCPGKYDLSVKGQKFAGMAQYRTKDAVMVMITFCVAGDQKQRCALIRDFYALANPAHDPKYPLIDPDAMATLCTLAQRPLNNASITALISSQIDRHLTFVNSSIQL